MNSANRRGFLKIAGTGAAVAGAASLTSVGVASAQSATKAPAVRLPAAATGSMVAYIHDVSTGEVAVMIEGREVMVTDHTLVAKLATAVHAAST